MKPLIIAIMLKLIAVCLVACQKQKIEPPKQCRTLYWELIDYSGEVPDTSYTKFGVECDEKQDTTWHLICTGGVPNIGRCFYK